MINLHISLHLMTSEGALNEPHHSKPSPAPSPHHLKYNYLTLGCFFFAMVTRRQLAIQKWNLLRTIPEIWRIFSTLWLANKLMQSITYPLKANECGKFYVCWEKVKVQIVGNLQAIIHIIY